MFLSRAHVGCAVRAAVALAVWALVPAWPAAGRAAQDSASLVSGEISSLTLDAGGEAGQAGTAVVSGVRVTIPAGLVIDLPATTLTLEWLFREAPARCRQRGESGLAKGDTCRVESSPQDAGAPTDAAAPPRDPVNRTGPPPPPRVVTEIPPARATIEVARSDEGRLTATAMRVTRNLEQLMGGVTFINPDEGYIRINGYYRQDVGGTLIRANDPFRQHGDQRGAACGSEANCSSDARFRVGASTITVLFEQGNPACVGAEAQGCYAADRKLASDDPSIRIPILVGDNVVVEGAFEIANGSHYFSAQSIVVQANLSGGR